MSEKTELRFIIIHETPLQSWIRDASTFALFSSLIGVGIALDSSAMQWAGFLVAMVAILSRVGTIKAKRMTRQEALAHLQTMEPSA